MKYLNLQIANELWINLRSLSNFIQILKKFLAEKFAGYKKTRFWNRLDLALNFKLGNYVVAQQQSQLLDFEADAVFAGNMNNFAVANSAPFSQLWIVFQFKLKIANRWVVLFLRILSWFQEKLESVFCLVQDFGDEARFVGLKPILEDVWARRSHSFVFCSRRLL